jgi:hypothetical protein
MHDPSVLVFDVPLLRLDVWHDEPNGADSGTVCKGHRSSDLTWPNVRWAWTHRSHLHYRWWPYLRVNRWLTDHCVECGRRFFWKDERHGYMSGDRPYHRQCMSLRHVRSERDDLTGYVRGTADWNARWRVEYRLKLDEDT